VAGYEDSFGVGFDGGCYGCGSCDSNYDHSFDHSFNYGETA